jgi:hypothetical protein
VAVTPLLTLRLLCAWAIGLPSNSAASQADTMHFIFSHSTGTQLWTRYADTCYTPLYLSETLKLYRGGEVGVHLANVCEELP